MNIQNNTHEMEIKLLCASWLEEKFGLYTDGVLINEFSANKSKVRADLVYVSPREIVAIEIKSKKDKITRLKNQVRILKKLYNRVEVITVSKHHQAAKEICVAENVALHIVENTEIKTVLKGRRRKMDELQLRSFVFPINIQKRADFSATEEYYRNYLIKKYKKSHQNINPIFEIDAEYIRSLNPHHARRIKVEKNRNAYREDLEALLRAFQSTQSSSNS